MERCWTMAAVCVRRVFAAGLLLGAAACAPTQDFASRAINYNRQAERTKDSDILLNIIRAAFRKPLQFTQLQSITGQDSASATAGFSLPFLGPRAGGPRLFTFSPSLMASSGPNYSVAVLDTKEFYQGILTPIPESTAALYVKSGISKETLLMLLVSEIRYGPPTSLQYIYNAPRNMNDALLSQKPARYFTAFSQTMKELIDDGLDFEEVDTPEQLGPTLTRRELSDPRKIADLDAKKIKIVKVGQGGGARFRLEKTTASYRFCFNLARAKLGVGVGTPIPISGNHKGSNADLEITPASLCGAPAGRQASSPAGQKARPVLPPGRQPGVYVLLRSPAPRHKTGAFPGAAPARIEEITLRMRSVAGILSYLGEIARSDLGLSEVPFAPRVGWREARLFRLARGPGGSSAIAVSYQGRAYHVPIDASGTCNRSGQVLDLVAELLALNSSAKSLPAPNIIPVISR